MYARDAVCNERIFLGPSDVLNTGNCTIMNTPWDFLPMATYDPALCLGGKQIQAPGILYSVQHTPIPALPQVSNHTVQPPVAAFASHETTFNRNDATPTKKRRVMKHSVDGRQKD